MIKKLLLSVIVWSFCLMVVAKAGTGYHSGFELPISIKDSSNTIRYFHSVRAYYGFLGSIPFTSLNFEPTILRTGKYFINLGFSCSNWHYYYIYYFFQSSLLGGIKLTPRLNLYGGFSYKASHYSTSHLLENKNWGADLFANLGIEYITKSNIFFRFGLYSHFINFLPNKYEDDRTFYYLLFTFWSKDRTPQVPYGFGIGYLISDKKQRTNNNTVCFPQNTIGVVVGLQIPSVRVSYERLLMSVGHYALTANIGYRYADDKDINRKRDTQINNTVLEIDNHIGISPAINFFLGFSLGYYYITDYNKPSYFNELAAQSGVCLSLGKHLQLKYYINFPFYYFNVRPKLRTEFYFSGCQFISAPKVSIGYSFGYKKH